MKKRLVFVFCTLMFLFSLSACGTSKVDRMENEINDLKSQVKSLTEENNSLQEKNISFAKEIDRLNGLFKSSDTELISIIFWYDGNLYTVGNCKFYSDEFCSKQVDSTNIRFYNKISYPLELENGNRVFFSLSNKGIVWSVDEPYFEKVELEE